MTKFEQVTGPLGDKIDPDIVQRNFDALAADGASFGGKSVEMRYGVATLTWAGGVTSNVVAVSHGLGRVPVVVVFGVKDSPQAVAGQIPGANGFGYSATQFSVDAEVRVAYTGTQVITWIAIG